MKNQILIFCAIFTFTFNAFGQKVPECAVNIGGNYYINSKHIILFNGQDILSITNTETDTIGVNFDVFSSEGKKIVEVKLGQIQMGNKSLYSIKSSSLEYTFMEIDTKRIICYVKKLADNEKYDCVYAVYVDMYMPDGKNFQCTPETTNNPVLNGMKGNTFKNALSVIILQ
ncbi:MAG: hypothetical protein IPP71_09775 [Bacteroidetes bacterium]|nr:hypothetical protein [Bacteroidota bacterium]